MAVEISETRIAQRHIDREIQTRREDIANIQKEILRLKLEHNIVPPHNKRNHPYRLAAHGLINQRRELQREQSRSRAKARALQLENFLKYIKKGG